MFISLFLSNPVFVTNRILLAFSILSNAQPPINVIWQKFYFSVLHWWKCRHLLEGCLIF